MKVFTACLVLALAGSYVGAVEEEVARAWIKCVNKTLDGGLPKVNIPDHNPFVVTRNLTFNYTVGLTNVLIEPHNLKILDIPLFKIDTLHGEYTDDDNTTIKYDYGFSYRQLRIVGEYRVRVSVLGLPVVNVSGSLNNTFVGLELLGSWTQSTAGPRNRTLEALQLIIKAERVDVEIDGLSAVATTLVEYIGGSGLQFLINTASEFPSIVNLISNGLASRINANWLVDGHQDRIDAIIANCQ